MIPSIPEDDISLLAHALVTFLEELETHRQVCIRHASSTVVTTKAGAIRLQKKYRYLMENATFIAKHVRQLREKQCSMPKGEQWKKCLGDRPRGTLLFENWVQRGTESLLVSITMGGGTLTVTTVSPPSQWSLPDLPLRRVAQALASHEMLVPGWTLSPMCVSRDRRKLWSLQSYLLRSMKGVTAFPPCVITSWNVPGTP